MVDCLLEVCVADAQSLAAAIEGGADRIELCSSLELGGLTPAPGLIAQAARAPIPVYAMIRPRSGDLVFDEGDVDAMLRDIEAVREAGLAGVVLGASRPSGELDEALLRRLSAASEGLGKTLHRAFDLVPDLAPAIATAVELGFERILTSGRKPTALEGLEDIAAAHAIAGGRISVMAGSGVKAENVAQILARIPLTEVHASCSVPVPSQGTGAVRLGFASAIHSRTSAEAVRRLKSAITE